VWVYSKKSARKTYEKSKIKSGDITVQLLKKKGNYRENKKELPNHWRRVDTKKDKNVGK